MGGMFTTFKVRKNLGANDYRDPGWYQHPKGTVAYEWQGAPLDAQAPRQTAPGTGPGARCKPETGPRRPGQHIEGDSHEDISFHSCLRWRPKRGASAFTWATARMPMRRPCQPPHPQGAKARALPARPTGPAHHHHDHDRRHALHPDHFR
jgi:hypothetical protein